MAEKQFARYDSADYLKTEEDIAAYLEAVMEEGGDDPAYITRALGVVARARNMTALAQKVGMIPTRASAPDRVRSGEFSSRATRTRKPQHKRPLG